MLSCAVPPTTFYMIPLMLHGKYPAKRCAAFLPRAMYRAVTLPSKPGLKVE